MVATVLRLAFDPEVKVHKQTQALKILHTLYSNKVVVEERSKPEAAVLEQDLYSKALKGGYDGGVKVIHPQVL